MHTLPKWHLIVPEFQSQPVECDFWSEEEKPQFNSTFEVDNEGFFVHVQCNNSEDEVLEICQISDVRPGVPKDSKCLSHMNTHYNEVYGTEWQKHVFTVCSGSDLVDISYHHFMCCDAHKAEVWRESILKIAKNNAMNNLSAWTNLKKQWMRLQRSRDQHGNIPVKLISRTFGSGRGERDVFKVLQEVKLTGSDDPSTVIEPSVLTFDRFYQLYLKMCWRDDVEDLFKTLAKQSSNTISAEKFATFLNEHQRDHRLNEILFPKKKPEAAKEIIQRFEVDKNAKENNELTRDGFIRFLMSDENSPINLNHLNVYMDMDQPLSHYFINSSHNTYLTGRQFYGKSSVEMYRQVLLAGCRCVELDSWDGEDGEPMITHGKAICTCIPFKDVLYAIRDTAFVTSQYPVILSLENHCCKRQQKKMAMYCEEIFGDLLLKEPLPDHPLEPGRPLPSPNALKGKILLKNKRLDNEKEDENSADKEVPKEEACSLEVTEEEPKSPLKETAEGAFAFDSDALQNGEQGDQVNDPSQSKWDGPHCTNDDLEVNDVPPRRGIEEEVVEVPQIVHTSSTTNVHPYLSKMVNYAQPIKFHSFEEAQRKNIHHNMSSFSETTGLSMLNSDPIEFVNYNKRQMSRIYPRGTRLDSTNFMPQIFWSAGCQMVALNFQTPDVAMQINQGKFEYNGNSGYLLKPDPMRSSHRDFNLFANSAIDGVVAAQLKVQVLSGQFLSDRRIGTYVEVEMYGLRSDTIRKEFRTKIVPSNGLNPRYEGDPFCFRKVVLPEFAVLRFGVYDETNRLLGQRVIPFESLHSGYRHIPLRTEGNFPMTLPTLFCHMKLSVYVPAHHMGSKLDCLLRKPEFGPVDIHSGTSVMRPVTRFIGTSTIFSGPREAFLDLLNSMSSKEESKEGEVHQLKKEPSYQDFDLRSEFRQMKSYSFSDIEGGFTEISEAPSSTQALDRSGKGCTSKKGSKSKMDEEKVSGFPYITVDMLKQDNDQFSKLIQKQEKKLRHQKIKHAKQLEAMSRTQCLATEKLRSPKRKIKPKPEAGVPDIMSKQVQSWSKLKEDQRQEELLMRENHLKAQFDKLERLMKVAQARQIKELEEKHKRNTKRINSNQAKSSIRAIEQVRSDATLRSNGEKERCVREKKEQMTKVFAEERKQIIRRQESEMASLLEQHKKQLEDIEKEEILAMEKIANERKENEIDTIREFCA